MVTHVDFVIERLAEAPVFQAIDRDELEVLAHEVDIVHLNAGAMLTQQGEAADGAYLLVSGRLRAFAVQADGSEMPVGEVASGELVGEMALLSAAPRTATVRAIRDCQLFFVKREVFDRIIHTRPAATLAIARVLVERLERANAGRSEVSPRRAIALVPAFGDCRPTVAGLIAALQEQASCRVVDESAVAAALGSNHSEAELLFWLQRLEAAANLVIYVADCHDSSWAGRCMRQADHIVAIDADPGGIGERRVVEALEALTMGVVGASVDAVVVHPAARRLPIGGHRWTRGHRIRVHHIRHDTPRDLRRAARTMLRRDVAMVLSGGGARGMAHVGVIRAFAESRIPIDVVGGSSFGALVAMGCALDMSWQEMRDMLWEAVGRDGAPIDVTPPLLALSKGRRLMNVLDESFGNARLENLWLRCYFTSSNLTTGHSLVHTTGSAVAALRASIAIPGVFPPMATGDGEVLVDGAVMNNLPVDVMSSFSNGGPIIAVNLHSAAEIEAGALPRDGIVSGWRVLLQRIIPLQNRTLVPSVVEILTRSSEIGGAEASRVLEQSADYVLHPPTGEHALLEFGALDDLIRLGYEYTLAELDSWRAAGRPLPGELPATSY